MKRLWTLDELVEQWSVDPSDKDLLLGRETTGRLGLIAQLAFYRRYTRFPGQQNEFARVVLEHLAEQIEVPEIAPSFRGSAWPLTSGNSRSLLNYADAVRKAWHKWLCLRSQRNRLNWERYNDAAQASMAATATPDRCAHLGFVTTRQRLRRSRMVGIS
jgi:hypothetical protein